jgi:hypothetical protein
MPDETTAPEYDIDLNIRPPLAPGKALVIVVRNKQCFHRIVGVEDTKILDSLFAEVINDAT